MDGLYDWIWNLGIYFILLTAVTGVLPRDGYRNYLRLFTGAVMVLVMLNPLMKLWNLDLSMETLFRSDFLKQERRELSYKMDGMRDVGQEYVMEQYRQALQKQLDDLAGEEGVRIRNADFLLEEDESNPNYGRVLYLTIDAKDIPADFADKAAGLFGMPKENINLGGDYE